MDTVFDISINVCRQIWNYFKRIKISNVVRRQNCIYVLESKAQTTWIDCFSTFENILFQHVYIFSLTQKATFSTGIYHVKNYVTKNAWFIPITAVSGKLNRWSWILFMMNGKCHWIINQMNKGGNSSDQFFLVSNNLKFEMHCESLSSYRVDAIKMSYVAL